MVQHVAAEEDVRLVAAGQSAEFHGGQVVDPDADVMERKLQHAAPESFHVHPSGRGRPLRLDQRARKHRPVRARIEQRR
ncbi:MAG: hypothetical protein ACRC33_21530, partial [Gemmataceae bacterium]